MLHYTSSLGRGQLLRKIVVCDCLFCKGGSSSIGLFTDVVIRPEDSTELIGYIRRYRRIGEQFHVDQGRIQNFV